MSNTIEKCFCHIKDADGNVYVVKDKEARERLAALEADDKSDDTRLAAVEAVAANNTTRLTAVEGKAETARVNAAGALTDAYNAKQAAQSAQSTATSALAKANANATALDGCVKKKGAGEYSRVYGVTANGVESGIRYSVSTNANSLVQRDANGLFKVKTPEESAHPTPMSYVDSAVSAVNTALNNLKKTVDSLTALDEEGITKLQSDLSALTTEVDTLKEAHNSSVTALEQSINEVRSSIPPGCSCTVSEEDITSLDTKISSEAASRANADDALDNRLAALEEYIPGWKGYKPTNTKKISAINITDFSDGNYTKSGEFTLPYYDGRTAATVLLHNTAGVKKILAITNITLPTEGKTVTLSAYGYTIDGSSVYETCTATITGYYW